MYPAPGLTTALRRRHLKPLSGRLSLRLGAGVGLHALALGVLSGGDALLIDGLYALREPGALSLVLSDQLVEIVMFTDGQRHLLF